MEDIDSKSNKHLNTVSRSKGTSSRHQLFSNILQWSDGQGWSDHHLAKKVLPDPISQLAWAGVGAKIGKKRQIDIEKIHFKVSIFDL